MLLPVSLLFSDKLRRSCVIKLFPASIKFDRPTEFLYFFRQPAEFLIEFLFFSSFPFPFLWCFDGSPDLIHFRGLQMGISRLVRF